MIKVGDRVIVGNPKREELGFHGTVEEIVGTNVCVRFDENDVPYGDNGHVCWFHERELEIAEYYYTEEGEKVYENENIAALCGTSMYGDTKTPESVLQSCIDLYKTKNKEYQNTEDQFENFTKGAELNQCSREQTLWGYVTKQIVSLASIIQTGKNREKISEKAKDIIVYMAILEAMQ